MADPPAQVGNRITGNGDGVVVVARMVGVGVEIDDGAGILPGGTRAVPLAYRPAADNDHQVGLVHGVVAGNRSLGSPHRHVAGLGVGDNTAA